MWLQQERMELNPANEIRGQPFDRSQHDTSSPLALTLAAGSGRGRRPAESRCTDSPAREFEFATEELAKDRGALTVTNARRKCRAK